MSKPGSRPATLADYLSLERNVSIASAAVFLIGLGEELIGGLLWKINPEVPFVVAAVIGLLGTIVFAATVEERFAS